MEIAIVLFTAYILWGVYDWIFNDNNNKPGKGGMGGSGTACKFYW